MYGTQTTQSIEVKATMFENDVKMYGTQTLLTLIQLLIWFENDVKMYGTQTNNNRKCERYSLRMM